MLLVYFSLTGQTRRFIKKLGIENSLEITPGNAFSEISEPFLLFVPTYEVDVTAPVFDFLDTKHNAKQCLGVIGSGNRNFADKFIFTAKDISAEYNLPLLYAFEFNGTMEDVDNIKKVVEQLES
jgi:protein involved in ribonucleotide reduction